MKQTFLMLLTPLELIDTDWPSILPGPQAAGTVATETTDKAGPIALIHELKLPVGTVLTEAGISFPLVEPYNPREHYQNQKILYPKRKSPE